MKAAEITQYTPEQVMGKDLVKDFITPDYQYSVERVLKKALGGVETSNFGKIPSSFAACHSLSF